MQGVHFTVCPIRIQFKNGSLSLPAVFCFTFKVFNITLMKLATRLPLTALRHCSAIGIPPSWRKLNKQVHRSSRGGVWGKAAQA